MPRLLRNLFAFGLSSKEEERAGEFIDVDLKTQRLKLALKVGQVIKRLHDRELTPILDGTRGVNIVFGNTPV